MPFFCSPQLLLLNGWVAALYFDEWNRGKKGIFPGRYFLQDVAAVLKIKIYIAQQISQKKENVFELKLLVPTRKVCSKKRGGIFLYFFLLVACSISNLCKNVCMYYSCTAMSPDFFSSSSSFLVFNLSTSHAYLHI